jgi:hypothetical protein
MSTYILPCYGLNNGDLWLEKVRARSFTEAEDKFINLFVEDYDIDPPGDYDELAGTMAKDREIIIGDIYDIEEF